MNWILENIWVVVAIAGVAAKLFQAVKEKSSSRPPARRPDAERRDSQWGDLESEERARKIREEIQRKIRERQSGGDPSAQEDSERARPPRMRRSPEATRPVNEPESMGDVLRELLDPAPRRVEVDRASERRAAEEAERQGALAERLREAEEMRAAAAKRAAFEQTRDRALRGGSGKKTAWREELRSPETMRRALVLREILGPPVGLR